jgi:hypothetical protein
MTKLATVLAAAFGIGAIASASAAYAFNPQPDPPARIRKSFDPGNTKLNKFGKTSTKTSTKASAGSKVTVSPGPCRDASKCGNAGAMSPGLLGGDGTAFGSQGPSSAGAPVVGGGSRGSGAAGIR